MLTGGSVERDDCYVYNSHGESLLFSTDLITRKTHLPEGTEPLLAGKFFAALNLSDIAAMAGIPVGLLVSLSVSPDYEIKYLEDFYAGIKKELTKYNSKIIGGDTKEGEDFTVSGTVIGKQKYSLIRKRSYIKKNQLVMITNKLGSAGAGYIFYKYTDRKNYGINKMLGIEPRINEAIKIAENGALFMMDLSDGLFASIDQMKNDYGTGFKLYIDKIPMDNDVNLASELSGFTSSKIALDFGGDYELLFTIERDNYNNFMAAMESNKINVSCIGETYEGDNIIYDKIWKKVNDVGFEHFRKITLDK